MEIVRITYEVNVHIDRCMDRLSTFASLNHFLILTFRGLDLASCVLHFCQFLIGILFHEVIVSSKNRASLTSEIGALELLSIFDAFTVLILFFLQIVFVKARCLISVRMFSSSRCRLICT